MLELRSEVATIARACEYLISETMMKGHDKLTDDECQVLNYYAGELWKVTQSESSTTASVATVSAAMESLDIPERWRPCTIAAIHSDVESDS